MLHQSAKNTFTLGEQSESYSQELNLSYRKHLFGLAGRNVERKYTKNFMSGDNVELLKSIMKPLKDNKKYPKQIKYMGGGPTNGECDYVPIQNLSPQKNTTFIESINEEEFQVIDDYTAMTKKLTTEPEINESENDKNICEDNEHLPLINLSSLMNDEEDFQDVQLTDLDKISKENPLTVFSECDAEGCALKRTRAPHFRWFFEDQFEQVTKDKDSIGENVVWTIYAPGYMFQEIILLSILAKNGVKNLTINIIDAQIKEYADCVGDLREIYFGFTDPNHQRQQWLNLLHYRFVKLLEWCISLSVVAKIVLYGTVDEYLVACNGDKTLQSDLITGTDYIDEIYEYISEFRLLGLCGIKQTGIVASLRTDGLCAKFNVVMEIYRVTDSERNLAEYMKYSEKEIYKFVDKKMKFCNYIRKYEGFLMFTIRILGRVMWDRIYSITCGESCNLSLFGSDANPTN